MVWAKKLPASQPLHVWPGTALSRLFWGLSKAHHGKEAVSVGMLRGARARQGGETRDLAQQLGHNEEENSYSCILINVTTTMHFCQTLSLFSEIFILRSSCVWWSLTPQSVLQNKHPHCHRFISCTKYSPTASNIRLDLMLEPFPISLTYWKHYTIPVYCVHLLPAD